MVPQRITQLVAAIEQGQSVDFRRLALLQSLDVAAAGEQFAADVAAAERAADDEFERFANRLAG